jgi:parallel beta-helix repeat protein
MAFRVGTLRTEGVPDNMKRLLIYASAAGLAGAVLSVSGLATTAASAHSSTVYVSPSGQAKAAGWSCGTAAYSSIQAAVNAAPLWGTVVVCPGTYKTSVTIGRTVNLHGRPGAVINAKGQPYGVGVAASWVTVSGLTVENASSTANHAPADGILTAGFIKGVPKAASHVTITGNTVRNNKGSGIDLNSTSYSVASGNTATGNGVGINVSNDVKLAASHNRITGNVADDNPGGCGIVLADHSGSGVYDNVVSGNVANDNGLGTPSAPNASAGSGIILAAAGPKGGVYGNTVSGNSFSGNGHGGVTLHAHVKGLNFGGNAITGNWIGRNNVRTDSHDLKTTGIYLADASPLTITVLGNTIDGNYYGIFTAGKVTVKVAKYNRYQNVTHPTGSYPTYP